MDRETNQPAPDLVTLVRDVPGSADTVPAMRSADNRPVWIYVSHGQTAESNGQRLPGGRLVATWFNPREGSRRVVRLKPRARLTINPPGEADSDNGWLLEICGPRAD
ncbi:MAG: hypothetical protein H6994_03245 [Pseudomonadales bacterium]|nr:hypothetical protein [Pseudomonadales bacterium]